MSGPKVFHVVTREELVARCEVLLGRLEAAIDEWAQACEKSRIAGLVDFEAVKARRDAFRKMLDEDRFGELQKHLPAEISFLRADAETRMEKAAAETARAAQNLRRAHRAAQALLEALDKAGKALPEDLRRRLENPGAPDDLNTAISRAFTILAPQPAAAEMTDRQRELASSLGRDERRATLADWLASQQIAEDRESDLRIDRHLAELQTFGLDTTAYSARATSIAGEPTARQALLADSLLLDLAQAVKLGRQRATLAADLRERGSALTRYTSTASRSLRERIERSLTQELDESAMALLGEADALIESQVRAIAVESRRRTVLQGLSSLGYEVNEGMITAWVNDGRVVLRKAANPDYGVEVGGGAKSDNLQVRVVSFGDSASPRNASRDRDMETAWCSDFDKLRGLVSEAGGDLEIEHALPVGATPVKVVGLSQTQADWNVVSKLKLLER